MSDAELAQGFQLDIGDEGDLVGDLTEVKEIKTFQGFDGEANEIDVTHLKSPAKEFKLGLEDLGSFGGDMNFVNDDPGQVELRAAKSSRVVKQFLATFPSGVTATFLGYVKTAPMTGAVDEVIGTSYNIKITGAVVFA